MGTSLELLLIRVWHDKSKITLAKGSGVNKVQVPPVTIVALKLEVVMPTPH